MRSLISVNISVLVLAQLQSVFVQLDMIAYCCGYKRELYLYIVSTNVTFESVLHYNTSTESSNV